MKHRADGSARCTDCGADPEPGRTRCAAHAEQARKVQARVTRERKRDGRCVVCGARAKRVRGETRTVCAEHMLYYHRRRNARLGYAPPKKDRSGT